MQKTTVEFLDAVMKKHGITSDNKLSAFLGCTRSGISGYRYKKSYLDDEIALRVADALGLDPAYVVACCHAERERNAEVKKVWTNMAKRLSAVAAAVLAVVFLPGLMHAPGDLSPALLVGFTASARSNFVYYVK